MWKTPAAFFGDVHSQTRRLIGKVADLVAAEGIEAWFDLVPETLLDAAAKDYDKSLDTLDVWFDSGVTHSAVMGRDGGDASRPDMCLEGSDQHRGWFMSFLMTGCALHGRAPFRQILSPGSGSLWSVRTDNSPSVTCYLWVQLLSGADLTPSGCRFGVWDQGRARTDCRSAGP